MHEVEELVVTFLGLRINSYTSQPTDSLCISSLGATLPAWQSAHFNTNSFIIDDIIRFNNLSNKRKNENGTSVNTPILANTWNLAKMNTCFQLTNNGNVNSQTEGGLCNSVTKYKEILVMQI